MNKNAELMGKIVTIDHYLKKGYVFKKHSWIKRPMKPSRAGWIVGTRTLQEGDLVIEYEYSYLDIKNVLKVHLVAFWPSMKPVPVLVGEWEEGGEPYPPNGSPKERAEHKEYYQKNHMYYIRDEKGRFADCG